MGVDFVCILHLSLHLPPNHEPIARPNIKTETTTDNTGVMTPNDANAILSQIIWYNKPQKPEITKRTKIITERLGLIIDLASVASIAWSRVEVFSSIYQIP